MFRGLRLRLTLLYLSAALALIALLGAGTYLLIHSYFQSSTDLALRFRMAQEFRLLGQALPPELDAAVREWLASRGSASTGARPTSPPASRSGGQGEENEGDEQHAYEPAEMEAYDGELAAIFAFPLTAGGQPISNPNPFTTPLTAAASAASASLAKGSDLRTVELSEDTRVRLLTYRLSGTSGPAILQLGRTLNDQDRLLNQLMMVLLVLGGLCALALAAGSWWLAGRSLLPAQHAWEKQQAFVANASHELRTPLTLMRASAEVALRGLPATDSRRTLLGDILSESDHMNKLVEDLLLLSRLDAGRLKLERKQIPLGNLLTAVERQVGRLASEKGIALSLEGATGSVWGDPTRVRQVLLALLDNALQHTPSGGSIRLAARTRGHEVEITVADTGSGVPEADIPHVFERFYRSEDGRAGGSGLGLAIAKALVEEQHGQLRLESPKGEGTRATLVLPAAD